MLPETNIIEGRWEDILMEYGGELAGHKVKICFEPLPEEDKNKSWIQTITDRLNNRTEEEILEDRRRVLASSRKPLPLPPGKTLADVFDAFYAKHGKDDMSDEEVNRILREYS